jgi:hypothetical protein
VRCRILIQALKGYSLISTIQCDRTAM